jgi:hypothetical protein
MAISILFKPPAMSAAQYDAILGGLKGQGAFPPAGLRSHVAFGPQDRLYVHDVWDSLAQFEAFKPTLYPQIARVLGLPEGSAIEAEIDEVHLCVP